MRSERGEGAEEANTAPPRSVELQRRARVVQAYAAFIRQDTPLAGLVASDLGDWGRWEFDQSFAALMRSGRSQTFASRYGMVFYLMRNPRPEARAVLSALRAEGAL